MSQRRVYVTENGQLLPRWLDEGPQSAHSRASRAGTLVRGGPGPYEAARIAARIRTQRDADLRREAQG